MNVYRPRLTTILALFIFTLSATLTSRTLLAADTSHFSLNTPPTTIHNQTANNTLIALAGYNGHQRPTTPSQATHHFPDVNGNTNLYFYNPTETTITVIIDYFELNGNWAGASTETITPKTASPTILPGSLPVLMVSPPPSPMAT
ncbi:MAG TPA: hypothetical protein VLL52_23680 [Anaerolineae bacterium]|nr:hypothetical protein [Anaerolineae bacterium]